MGKPTVRVASSYNEASSKARESARLARAEAQYDVAKEKCDDQKGDAKSACEKQASADEAKGKADIKAMKKM